MKTLRQIKDEYAQERGFEDWFDFTHEEENGIEKAYERVCVRYARECCKSSLEKASNKINSERPIRTVGSLNHEQHRIIDSCLIQLANEENIVLL